jgi:hypothetical protein
MDFQLAWQSVAANSGPFLAAVVVLTAAMWILVNFIHRRRMEYLRETLDTKNEKEAREMAATLLLKDRMNELHTTAADLDRQIADAAPHGELAHTSSALLQTLGKMQEVLVSVLATWDPRMRRVGLDKNFPDVHAPANAAARAS